jgi:hypothetical protein
MRALRRDVLVVAALATAARAIAAVWFARDPAGLSDPAIYRAAAGSIAAGDGYASLLGEPTAYYPPGYPLLLGALQWVADLLGAGGGLTVANAAVHAVLGGVAAGATVVAGREVATAAGADVAWVRRTGLASGGVLALWPNLVLYASTMLSETLAVMLGAVALAALLRWTATARPGGATGRFPVALAVAAVALGAATLVRPQASLVTVPAAAVAWAAGGLGRRRVLIGAGALLAGVALFVLPWTIRNVVVMDHPVPMSTNTGDNLCIGFHDGATGGFVQTPACDTGGRYVEGPAVEVPRDGVNRDRALRWIADNPLELPALSARKLWITYRSDRDALAAAESYGAGPLVGDTTRRVVGAGLDLAWWAIAAAALMGAASLTGRVVRGGVAHRSPVLLVLLLVTVSAAFVPVLFFGDPRFKFAIAPQVALLAAWGAGAFFSASRDRGVDPVRDSGGPAGGTGPEEHAEQEEWR